MKLFILIVALAASAIAIPLNAEQAAARAEPATDYIFNQDELGQFDFEYKTAEGTHFKQQGKLVDGPDGKKVLQIEGEVSFIGDDGKIYTTKYNAGVDGSKMEGNHLPVASEVPDVITAEAGAASEEPKPETSSSEAPKPEEPEEKVIEIIADAIKKENEAEKLEEEKAEEKKPVIILTEEKLPEIVLPEITNIPEVVLPKDPVIYEPEVFTIPGGPYHITQVHIPREMLTFPGALQIAPLFLKEINQ